jgi:hypothetical protein
MYTRDEHPEKHPNGRFLTNLGISIDGRFMHSSKHFLTIDSI